MFNIFAALKILIARTGSSLGQVAFMVIREIFIPDLAKKMKREKNPSKKEKIQEVLDLWEQYSDERDSQSRMWEGVALKAVNTVVSKWRMSRDSANDIEQQVAYELFDKEKQKKIFDKFDPMDGPSGFARYWKTVLYYTVNIAVRNMMRKEPEHQFGTRLEETPEGRPQDILAPTMVTEADELVMDEYKAGLDQYIAQKFAQNPAAVMAYKMWMRLAERKGADNVTFSRDIEPAVIEVLKKKKLPHSHGTITNAWRSVVAGIVDFFEDKLHKPVSIQMKRNLKLAEELAYVEFYRRLAAWVLGR